MAEERFRPLSISEAGTTLRCMHTAGTDYGASMAEGPSQMGYSVFLASDDSLPQADATQ
jgi:hypothetical protein